MKFQKIDKILKNLYYKLNLKHAIILGITVGFSAGMIKKFIPSINLIFLYAIPYLVMGWLCTLPIINPKEYPDRKLDRVYIVSILFTFVGAVLFEAISRSNLL